jgi:RNA polymerase sigma factor (sigma-70 family)
VVEADPTIDLLEGVRASNGDDVRRLWNRYFRRLVRLARARLRQSDRRTFDEEDVTLSAIRSFCDLVGRGELSGIHSEIHLWRLISTITTRKLIGSLRRQNCQKRGGAHRIRDYASVYDPRTPHGLAQLLAREPTPQAGAELADDLDRLLAKLDDPMLKSLAVRKLEGFTTQEIADELGTSTRTIDRKLRLIRAIWERELLS